LPRTPLAPTPNFTLVELGSGKRYRCGKKTCLRGGSSNTRANQEIGGVSLAGSEGLGSRLKSIRSMSKRCKVEKGREGRTAACGAGPR